MRRTISDLFAGNAAPNGAVDRKDLAAAGYGYDSCGTDILAELTVDQGDVVLPCGRRYRLLVLPSHPFHTPAFARKLRELVRAGHARIRPGRARRGTGASQTGSVVGWPRDRRGWGSPPAGLAQRHAHPPSTGLPGEPSRSRWPVCPIP